MVDTRLTKTKVVGSGFGDAWTGKRCGAHARTTGKPCRSPAVLGKDRCRMHGGAAGSGAPRGKRNGSYRRGNATKAALEIQKVSGATLTLAGRWLAAREKGSASETALLTLAGTTFRELERVRERVDGEEER